MSDNIQDIIDHCEEIKKKRGYFFHAVPDSDFPNIHSHGLIDNFNMIEMQIGIFDGDTNRYADILDEVIQLFISQNRHIKDGDCIWYNDMYGNITFKLLRDEFGCLLYRLIVQNIPEELQFSEADKINNKECLQS